MVISTLGASGGLLNQGVVLTAVRHVVIVTAPESKHRCFALLYQGCVFGSGIVVPVFFPFAMIGTTLVVALVLIWSFCMF